MTISEAAVVKKDALGVEAVETMCEGGAEHEPVRQLARVGERHGEHRGRREQRLRACEPSQRTASESIRSRPFRVCA